MAQKKELYELRIYGAYYVCMAGAYTRSLPAQLELPLCPTEPILTLEGVPNVLKLISNVDECKPLVHGTVREPRAGHGLAHGVHRGRQRAAGWVVQLTPSSPHLDPILTSS